MVAKEPDDVLDDDVMVVQHPEVLWRVAPSHLVIATLDDQVHEAVGPAPDIWRAIEQPTAIGALIASLAETHTLAPEQIRDDVIAFLTDLVAAGAVQTDAGRAR